MEIPFSQACENNKRVILDVITLYFERSKMILEIGSGTGQHATYFADKLPNLYWQTSDQSPYLQGINCRINQYTHYNLGRPMLLDVAQKQWPVKRCDGVFSSNTSHIMSWEMVENMFRGVGQVLSKKGFFCLYGPFNFTGKYTASSNESFDKMLREQDPKSGLRNFEDLHQLAEQQGLNFVKRYEMPANNNILVWQKSN